MLVVALLTVTWSHGNMADTQAANPGDKTQLDIVINGGECDSSVRTTCPLILDSIFAVSFVPITIPTGGYIGWQTLLDYGSLLYKPAASPMTEVNWKVLSLLEFPRTRPARKGGLGTAT